MAGWAGVALAPATAHALCAQPGDPDCVDRLVVMTGTIDFFATGASFAVDDDDDDRADSALEVAEVVVPDRRIPPRAKLVQALLYFGGSLYTADGDGMDAPDLEVEVEVPGASGFATVRGDELHQGGSIPGFPEVVLYTVRADITELMRGAGGAMAGTYRVRGFAADIFDGAREHTAANASFSIVLIFEEPRLPPRTIAVFEGLEEVLGSTVTLDLSGFTVSPVPSGTLTYYSQEGDCNPGPGDCAAGNNLSGAERIRVIGADPARRLVLTDPLNPPNDVFNRTINTVDPPQTGVPGTDLDTFDITAVLRPGDARLGVEITSPAAGRSTGELIGLVYVIVGIDVFAPELRVDSRIDVSTARGESLDAYYPGDPLRLTFAVSNTGNLPATEVSLVTELPDLVTAYQLVEAPEGATVADDPGGGTAGRGRFVVDDLSVRHGEVSALVLLVETRCPLAEAEVLSIEAAVGAPREGGSPFTVTASVALLAASRCGPRFYLYGGGGCSAAPAGRGESGGSELAPWALLALLLFGGRGLGPGVLRRARRGLAVILGLGLGAGCGGGGPSGPDRPAPRELGQPCPTGDGMILVPEGPTGAPFCIDQYEASIEAGALGAAVQPADGDGSTTAIAQSKRFVLPARGVTWAQARAACRNAGKRLCTAEEWSSACGGAEALTYPYGEAFGPSVCNGHDALRGDVVETGAMIRAVPGDDGLWAGGCVSPVGAYDLSGNVWEWNETPYFDGTRRGLIGGSFRSNRVGLRCVIADNHASPDEADDAFGFRCCAGAP